MIRHYVAYFNLKFIPDGYISEKDCCTKNKVINNIYIINTFEFTSILFYYSAMRFDRCFFISTIKTPILKETVYHKRD